MGWSDKLLTGIEEIDEQHKVMFEVINRLEHAVSSEDKWSAVHFALVELTATCAFHFAVEEALMRLHDYPDLGAHIAPPPRVSPAAHGHQGTFDPPRTSATP
jgi:hemerythrin